MSIETLQTEFDLERVIEEYPNTSIVENRLGDEFYIREYDPENGSELRLVFCSLRMNPETKKRNPFLSHQIPGTNDYVYIEFADEEVIVSGTTYEDILGLMELAQGGLKIMEVYKMLDPNTSLQNSYNSIVYDCRQEPIQATSDCVSRTLEALNHALGE